MLDLLIRFSPYRSLTEKGNWVFYGKCCFATWFFWVLWFSHMIFLGVVVFSHDFSGCRGFLTWFFWVLWFSHMVFLGVVVFSHGFLWVLWFSHMVFCRYFVFSHMDFFAYYEFSSHGLWGLISSHGFMDTLFSHNVFPWFSCANICTSLQEWFVIIVLAMFNCKDG